MNKTERYRKASSGWVVGVQTTATLELKQTAHTPFISVNMSCNTVIFTASSVHEFVPVAYMPINLIYLNDFNESYVYF